MSWLNIFSGGIVKSIENIATEWIQTDKETAEAKTIMIKALDPNGKMRRDIALTIQRLYTVYIVLAVVLIMCQAFDISTIVVIDGEKLRSVDLAMDSIKELFVPITSLFGIITTASFGVNAVNSNKGK